MILTLSSSRHAVITDDDKDHPWVATVDRQKYPGMAEVLFEAAEEFVAASAKWTER